MTKIVLLFNYDYIYRRGGLMPEGFKYSDTNKRYHTQSYYLKQRFGCKVIKISLNCGFTCPNIDGTKGTGGCTYCLSGSGEFAGKPVQTVAEQFMSIKEKMDLKWPEGMYIPYFQANTNTYGPAGKIKGMIEEALALHDPDKGIRIAGIALSTRPDCVSDEVLEYFAELHKRTYFTLELGLQTIHDKTAERINRQHTYEDFLRCYERLRKHDINICVHLINGLPGETAEMMIDSARAMAGLELHSIKLHLLHILKGTKIAEEYLRGEFQALTLREYADIVCAQLEVLPPELIIQRVTGDGAEDSLIAPLWSLKKFTVMNEIDKTLVRNNSRQGIYYDPNRKDMNK